MIFIANISTPKDTKLAALKRTNLQVTSGLVYKVEFYFPPGSAGLMGVAVFDGLYQVWPSSVGEFFIGESQVIPFDDMYLKESPPFTFQIYTYNLDDTHAHSLSVRVGLVSKDVFLARFMPTMGDDYLNSLLKKMEAEKADRARVQKEKVPMTPTEWMEKITEPVLAEQEVPTTITPVMPEPIPPAPPAEPELPSIVAPGWEESEVKKI